MCIYFIWLYASNMNIVHHNDNYYIDISPWCSSADSSPSDGKVCTCYQRRMKRTSEERKKLLAQKKLPRYCGNYPTHVIITPIGETLSKERRETHKKTLIPIIQQVFDEKKLGKYHEIHYTQRIAMIDNTIRIELARNFDSLKKDPHRWNTTPEKLNVSMALWKNSSHYWDKLKN